MWVCEVSTETLVPAPGSVCACVYECEYGYSCEMSMSVGVRGPVVVSTGILVPVPGSVYECIYVRVYICIYAVNTRICVCMCVCVCMIR